MMSVIAHDFRLERPLSEGGMGAVYIAEQLSTGKRRALKLMRPELARDQGFRDRFALEARVGARIDSEHVVEVVGAGIDDLTGAPWLAMELLEGEDLGSLIERRNGLGFDEVKELFRQLGHALEKAHAAGIVHRDLKPENLFVARPRREGIAFTLKILDFGIAKLLSDSTTKAATGALGTPLWMAPEQADTQPHVGPTADIWPLGLMAYYALTRRLYWRAAESGGSLTALMREVLLDPVEAPSSRAEGGSAALPAGFDAWFARCVVRDPAQRFPTVREAISELLRLDQPRTVPPLTTSAVPPRGAATVVMPTPPRPAARKRWRLLFFPLLIIPPLTIVIVLNVVVGRVWTKRERRLEQERLQHEDESAEVLVASAWKRRSKDPVLFTARDAPVPVFVDDIALGETVAPLIVAVLFCDWTDDACVAQSKALEAQLSTTKYHLRIVYKDAVKRVDARAMLAAEALHGVFAVAGSLAFRKLRDSIFTHRTELNRANILAWVREAGVSDVDAFSSLLDEHQWRPNVDRSGELASKLRLSHTELLSNCVAADVQDAFEYAKFVAGQWGSEHPSGDPMTFDALEYSTSCVERRLARESNRSDARLWFEPYPFAPPGSEYAFVDFGIRYATARDEHDTATLKDLFDYQVVDEGGGKALHREQAVASLTKADSVSRELIGLKGTVDASDSSRALMRLRFLRVSTDSVDITQQELKLVRKSDGWRITEVDAEHRFEAATCIDRAAVKSMTRPVVAHKLFTKPTVAERSSGCIARVALLQNRCYEGSCDVITACYGGAELPKVTQELRIDDGILVEGGNSDRLLDAIKNKDAKGLCSPSAFEETELGRN